MPFDRPTLSTLVTEIRADLKTRLGITGAILRRSLANILATVWAGAVHLLYGFLSWLALQLFADTAEREYLLRKAALYGIVPIPATFADGAVTFTGVDTTVIPLGTVLVRDDGATFTTTASGAIGDSVPGELSLAVVADLAGLAGNTEAGAALQLQSPIAGADSSATVDVGDGDGIDGGNDEEDTEGTRTRLLLRLRTPPTGGFEPDYLAWTLGVAGVTRAWVYPHENGLGTVVVRFVRDDDPSIFPDAGEVAEVQAAIDVERPVTAEVTAQGPNPLVQPYTILLVLETGADLTATRAAVEAALVDLHFREAEPGDGVTDRGTIFLSAIQTAVGNAVGVKDYTITIPAANVVPGVGDLAVKGVVTWA